MKLALLTFYGLTCILTTFILSQGGIAQSETIMPQNLKKGDNKYIRGKNGF